MFKICILFVIITPSITPSMRYFSTLKVRVFTYSNVPSLPYHTILYCYNCGRPFKVCLIKLEVDFSDNTLYSFYLNFYWFNFSSFKDCNFSIIDLIRNISDIHQFRYFLWAVIYSSLRLLKVIPVLSTSELRFGIISQS